jgi:hypothetical protein
MSTTVACYDTCLYTATIEVSSVTPLQTISLVWEEFALET